MKKIPVEALGPMAPSLYEQELSRNDAPLVGGVRKILFVNCYQPFQGITFCPPIGILLLISSIRAKFSGAVVVDFIDMRIKGEQPEKILDYLRAFNPDVVAVSALNCESSAAYRVASVAKEWSDGVLTVLGGPVALRQEESILRESRFDWVLSGAADRTFPAALRRYFSGESIGNDIPGLCYKNESGIECNKQQDFIEDLDALPFPAWDLVDFDAYSRKGVTRMTPDVAGRRYAPVFTSRGCPYLCNYCHDIFTKKFAYRSVDNVIAEMDILYRDYGIREFHFVDDIFNLHKPRARQLLGEISNRWGGKVFLAFPNGLRADILDERTIDAFVSAGTFQVSISIETVTERLQGLIEKNLDIERAMSAIDEFSRRGVIVTGSFMLGFPTEKVSEIIKTAQRAIVSGAMTAHFFPVVPQPGTPIYDLAFSESREATLFSSEDEKTKGRYNSHVTWYQRAYGFPLHALISLVYVLFYFYPPRFISIVTRYPASTLFKSLKFFSHQVFVGFLASFFSWSKTFVSHAREQR